MARDRGVPPLANGKRIPRTILVRHVPDTRSPPDRIVTFRHLSPRGRQRESTREQKPFR